MKTIVRLAWAARHGKMGVFGVAALILALAALSIPDPSSGSASQSGLQNPGFEQGLVNWTTTAADKAVVVGTESSDACPTYADMGGATVAPYKGTKSLRLGTCRAISQSQTKGTNKASQTFIADSSQLQFAFRLFSWEHRAYDQFSFELKKGNTAVGTLASPVVVPMAGVAGGMATCSGALPCRINVDAGKAGEFVATQWIVATVDIPPSLLGQSLTLSYSVATGKDTSHATWAYFDNYNTPPVARFDFDVIGQVVEGDVVQFTDTSFDPDQPLDEIASWEWVIDDETINERNPISIFPNEGTYSACLTVTDTLGGTNQVCTGATANDGTPVRPLDVVNEAPTVNALDVEALSGQPAALSARVLEVGWEDTVSALSGTWGIDGDPPAIVQQDNLPFISTGIVTGEITATTGLSGTLSVTDGVATSSDDFDVTIVPNDPQRHEPTNNVLSTAPVLVSDANHLSWIQSAGDLDFFRVRLSDGQQSLLPPGGQVLVRLKGPSGAGLNADYDLVILAQLPGEGEFESGDAGQTGIETLAYRNGAYRNGAYRNGAYRNGAYRNGAYRNGAYRNGAYRNGSALYPLSQTGFNGLATDNVGGADITLDELGLGSLEGANVTVAAYSANLGTAEEVVLAQSDVSGTEFFVAVKGANGAFSAGQPYTLQIETSLPLDPALAIGPEVCAASPLVGSDLSNPPTTGLVDINPGFPAPNAAKTLIITQRERIIALADDPATAGVNEGLARWNALQSKLLALAQHPNVMADILSMPSTDYDSWDSNPCEVEEANVVAAGIRGRIQSRLGAEPTIQYVVLAGDDDVVPQRRVPDETIIGNEALYVLDALTKPGSPLYSSLLYGFVLTDDYYVDTVPTPWQGRELYVPDRSIGRLVETPEEIGAAADAFLTAGPSGGLLDYSTAQDSTALVTGYDFFSDGADVTAANLASRLNTSTLIDQTPADPSDDWTADELRCEMLGQPSGTQTDCGTRSVIAANAHWLHYGILSARGFGFDDFTDLLNSNETAAAGGATPALERKVVFTMGCHAGLNVPDRAALPPDPGLGIDPSLDFAQAMARQRAVFIASTGYGYGDDAGLGGTELLLTHFAKEMVSGDVVIGNALRDAKESFLLSLMSMTAYDEKSSIQLTMFGLPMYEVDVPEESASITPLSAEAAAPSETFRLHVEDGDTTTTTNYSIEEVQTSNPDNGSYFTARPEGSQEEGDVQVTAFRAVQPRIVIPTPSEKRIKGVLIKAGAFIDTAGSDPVISLPSQDWLLDNAEPQVCLNAFWPSIPITLNSVDPGGGGAQALVVTPGQFRCTSGSAATVTGVQRMYTSLTVEILYDSVPPVQPPDSEPPIVNEVSLGGGQAGSLNVTVDATDVSGISRIVLLKYSGGVITPTEVALPQGAPYTINVPNVSDTDDIAGEVVDGAGNVAYFTAKGSGGFTYLPVDLSAPPPLNPDPIYVTPGTATTFQLNVADFAQLDEPFYTIDFGDGLFGSGPVAASTITFTHVYPVGTDFPTTAKVKVMDASGRLGSDTITVRLLCDPIGDGSPPAVDYVTCDVTTTATTMTIAVGVVGAIDAGAQYRINILTATKNAQLKYQDGQVTGPLNSLVVTQVGTSELRFTFSLQEVGLNSSGAQLLWQADAQNGVQGGSPTGFPDRMPDSGTFVFVLP